MRINIFAYPEKQNIVAIMWLEASGMTSIYTDGKEETASHP
jgi:hypothetical protein